MNFKCLHDVKTFRVKEQKSYDTIRKTDSHHSAHVLFWKWNPFNTICLRFIRETTIIELFLRSIVPKSNNTILSCADKAIIEWRKNKISEFSRIILNYFSPSVCAFFILPCSSESILNNPELISNVNPNNMSRTSKRGLKVNFLLGFDVKVEIIISCTCINGLAIPETNKAIWTSADQSISHQFNKLYRTLMTGSLLINSNNRFDEISLPK